MKFRIIVLILIIVTAITACTNGEKKENKLTVENVITAIRAEGPELLSKGQLDDEFVVLNKVKPNVFSIGSPIEDTAKLENIHVYIFDSEQARKDGLITFNKHLETAKLAFYVKAYEQKNALVIYYSLLEKDSKFGDKIQRAMEKL
ncbi:hypothetical protein [Paenibacillus sp. Soil787]|uniref:hypothetical protein n=1 Tax=Paenibacillus sp. Soil787 TaxID=1736411 RepID=UPI00070255B7|nr:hypothetical protein [Paenibacillus sp. Soil787]KRF20222.1 hypothetical protein ASG93_31435 [Paenibacillus sp. Soil787]